MQNHSAQTPPTILLAAIALASPLALNAFIPAMPDAASTLGVSTSAIQLTFTLYLLTLALGQLICGPLADSFGRRPVLLIGFALHLCGSILGATAGDIDQLVIARVMQALGGCTGMFLARTILLDLHGRAGSAGRMGYIVMSIAIAQSIAPAIGGYLNLWYGWHSVFWLSLLTSTLIWIVAFTKLTETAPVPRKTFSLRAMPQRYADVLRAPRYLAYVAATTCIACAFYLFIGSMPYIVTQQLQGTSADFGTWFLVVSLSFMAGSFASTRLAKHMSPDRAMQIGNTASLAGGGAMLVSVIASGPSYINFFLPMALVIFGRGLSQPNAQASAISCASQAAGTASGLMGFIQLLIGAGISQLTPYLLAQGIFYVITPLALLPLGALICHHFAQRSRSAS